MLVYAGWEQYRFSERQDNLSLKFMEDETFCRKTLEKIPLGCYRQSNYKVQRNCFTGAELVDFLLDENIVSNTVEAVCMGQELLFLKKIEGLHIWNDEAGEPPVVARHLTPVMVNRPKIDPRFSDDRSLFRLGLINRQVTEWLASAGDIEEEIKTAEINKIILEKQKIMEGSSFGLFDTHNRFRTICADLVTSPIFDNVIILLILISICLIASENPSGEGSDLRLQIFLVLDITFTTLFTLEMLLKMVAHGVFKTQRSYLSSNWNRLDFVIVIVSLLSLSVKSLNFDYLKVLRVMRALRPLRLVSHSPELKAAFNAIVMITKPLLSFALVVNVFLLTFAILMTSLYRDKLMFCHSLSSDLNVDVFEYRYELDRVDCQGSFLSDTNSTVTLEWKSVDSNFDSVSNSFLTLYEMITMDNWPNIMYPAMDITEDDQHPIMNNSQYNALIFIIFIIVGAFCIGNVLVGIVVNKFSRSIQMGKDDAFLSDDQQKWLDSMKIAMTAKPLRRLPIPEKDEMFGLKRPIYLLVADKVFQNSMDLVILLNMLSMTINYFDQPRDFERGTFILEVIFSTIFFVEITLRFLAVSPREFFKVTWNVLDLLIVAGSLVGVFTTSSTINVSIFRLFRIGRILRLVKKSKNLTILVKTLHLSLFSLLNIGLLLLLSLFIFSIVGMHLFWDVDIDGRVLTNHQNFKSLGVTMLLLFRCITGEGWTTIMHYLMDQGFQEVSPFYFIFFLTVNQYVLLSLFVAVILNNFATALQYDPDKVNKRNLEDFINVWAEIHDELDSGDKEYYLPSFALVSLLQRTEAPLGIKNVTQDMVTPNKDIHKIDFIVSLIHTLELKEDYEGKINFIDTVAALIRNLHKNNKSLKNIQAKFEGETMMSKDQEHELQLCLTKMCKTRLLNKIREGTKDQQFTDIDLAVLFNNAIIIQARWRGTVGRKEFVKLWYRNAPTGLLPRTLRTTFGADDMHLHDAQKQPRSSSSLMSKLFRLDSKDSSDSSVVSPGGRGRRHSMLQDMVKQSFNSLGSSFNKNGSRNDQDFHDAQNKFVGLTAQEMEKWKKGRYAPTINANVPDYVLSSDFSFKYKPPEDAISMKMSLLVSRPPMPMPLPSIGPQPPTPLSPPYSPSKAVSRPLLFKKFTPEKQDELVVDALLMPDGVISRELLFQRSRRNRSSYSIVEEEDEEAEVSVESEEEVTMSLANMDSIDVFSASASPNNWRAFASRSQSDDYSHSNSLSSSLSNSPSDSPTRSFSLPRTTSKLSSRSSQGSQSSSRSSRTRSRRFSGSSSVNHSSNSLALSALSSIRSMKSTDDSNTESPPPPPKPPLSEEVLKQRKREEEKDQASQASAQMEEAVARARARKEQAAARIKAQDQEKTAAALTAAKKDAEKAAALQQEKEERASARLRAKEEREAQRRADILATIARIEEREQESALRKEQEEEDAVAALLKAQQEAEIAAAQQQAQKEAQIAAAEQKARDIEKEKEAALIKAEELEAENARLRSEKALAKEAKAKAREEKARVKEEKARLKKEKALEKEKEKADALLKAQRETEKGIEKEKEESMKAATHRNAVEEFAKMDASDDPIARIIRAAEEEIAAAARLQVQQPQPQQQQQPQEEEGHKVATSSVLHSNAPEEDPAAQSSALDDAKALSDAATIKEDKARRREERARAKEEKARFKEEKTNAKLEKKRLKEEKARAKLVAANNLSVEKLSGLELELPEEKEKETEKVALVVETGGHQEDKQPPSSTHPSSSSTTFSSPSPHAPMGGASRGGRGDGVIRRLSQQQLSPFNRSPSNQEPPRPALTTSVVAND